MAAPASHHAAAAVAVFDLDGTLTYRDTFIPWLFGFVRRQPRRWWRFLGLLPIGLAATLGVRDRGRLKSWLLRVLAGGADSALLDAWSRDYAARVVAGQIRSEALATLQHHVAAGDHVIVLSASVDAYVPRIAALLGAHETLCTGVRWREDGRLDGRLTTANRQGEEKAVVLRSLRERFPGRPFAAYGNTSGDLPHLRLAERPLLVNANRRARRRARHLGIPTAEWP
jgi:phosphatidylglycerophosphatase C